MKLKKRISIFLLMFALVVAAIAGMLRRELSAHDAYASKLETAQNQIKAGMTKEQVVQIAGSPDVSRKLNENSY